MGRQTEFDKELGDYLSCRKNKKIDFLGVIKGFMPKPNPPPVELPPEIEPYGGEEKKTPEKSKPEEPKVTVETLDEEITGKKKSIWRTLIDRLTFKPYKKELSQKDKMIEEEEEGRIKEMVAKELMMKDLRDIAKITLYLIKQLPPERLKEFKQSSDWTDFKDILKKYKLIK